MTPSKELLDKIVDIKESIRTAGNMIKEAYDLAIRDGFTPQSARAFLTAELPFLSGRTFQRALPEEAKDPSKKRTLPMMTSLHRLQTTCPQTTDKKAEVVVNLTTNAVVPSEIKATVGDDYNTEDEEEPTPLELAEIRINDLENALKETKQAPELQGTLSTRDGAFTDDIVFKYLRDRATQTGDIIVIDRVGAGALVAALTQYKTSFKIAELFLRVIQ